MLMLLTFFLQFEHSCSVWCLHCVSRIFSKLWFWQALWILAWSLWVCIAFPDVLGLQQAEFQGQDFNFVSSPGLCPHGYTERDINGKGIYVVGSILGPKESRKENCSHIFLILAVNQTLIITSFWWANRANLADLRFLTLFMGLRMLVFSLIKDSSQWF